MGKRDKGKKDAGKKAARAEKQARKLTKGLAKAGGAVDGDSDEDLESLISTLQEKEKARSQVHISVVSQPSARSNFSSTLLTNGDLILFGGEYCNGECTVMYNDLFKWSLSKNEWKAIESINTPPPRCSHQAVYHNDKMYIFGGEYTTLDSFYHFRDMWVLDIKTNAWTEIRPSSSSSSGKTNNDNGSVEVWPSARSGHRMLVWRSYIVLFGGFYETKKEVHWYNDLYFFHIQEQKWYSCPYAKLQLQPRNRSGMSIICHSNEDVIYLYGGFSKEKQALKTATMDSSRKEAHIHDDIWMLDLKPVLATTIIDSTSGKSNGSSKKAMSEEHSHLPFHRAVWSKVSKKGYAPSLRCGTSNLVTHKNTKAILFGGVVDEEQPRHGMKSLFYNDIYSFDMVSRKWHTVIPSQNEGKAGKDKKGEKEEGLKTSGDSDDSDGNDGNDSDNDEEEEEENEKEESEKEICATDAIESVFSALSVSDRAEEPVTNAYLQKFFLEKYANEPCPRINASLFIKNNRYLHIYGGVTELDDVEITLDDCWMLDLNKRDGWHKLMQGNMHALVWKGPVHEGSTGTLSDNDSDEEEEEEEEDDDDDEESGRSARKGKKGSKGQKSRREAKEEAEESDEDEEEEDEEEEEGGAIGDGGDGVPVPEHREVLRAYYQRTVAYWTETARQEVASEIAVDNEDAKAAAKREKLVKTRAFSLAESCFKEHS